MRILHIISGMDPKTGGVCQALRSLIVGLQKEGIHNEVVCVDDPSANFIGRDPFPVYAMGPAKTSWAYSSKLKRWLKENIYNYNVLIIHGLWQYHSYAIHSVLKKRTNRPQVIIMPHGMLSPYFQTAKGRRLKAARNMIIWNFIEKKIINSSDVLFYTSEEEQNSAAYTFKSYSPNKVYTIGLGIDSPPDYPSIRTDFFTNKCSNSDGKPFLLFLGRLNKIKGIDLLIKAYKDLKSQNIDLLPQLVIAGPGLETEYGLLMQEMAQGDSDIIFPGMLYGNEKWSALYNCEAFILPSHHENFGMVLIEAMACGKAVLTTNKVNICREIQENHAGLVEDDTYEGILGMMKSWFALSVEDKLKMGVNAKNTYLKCFSIEKVTRKMIDVLSII